MKVLVLGASGATGKLVVKQLIKRQINTRIMVRKSVVLPEEVMDNPHVEIIKGNINELSDSEMNHLISGWAKWGQVLNYYFYEGYVFELL